MLKLSKNVSCSTSIPYSISKWLIQQTCIFIIKDLSLIDSNTFDNKLSLMTYKIICNIIWLGTFFCKKMTNIMEPIIRTRFTDKTAPLFTAQRINVCDDFELKFVTCMEAYGKSVGSTKCKDLKDDLTECIFKTKQVGFK